MSPTFRSYDQFAFFTFNEFHLTRMVAHDAPEVVEFVATQREWCDFKGYGFYSYSAHLTLADSVGGDRQLRACALRPTLRPVAVWPHSLHPS